VISDYSEGIRIHELAKKYGVHRATARGHLGRAGVSKRPRSMSAAQIEEAVQENVDGQSLEKIGKRLGVDFTTVLNELWLRGVQMRDPHSRGR